MNHSSNDTMSSIPTILEEEVVPMMDSELSVDSMSELSFKSDLGHYQTTDHFSDSLIVQDAPSETVVSEETVVTLQTEDSGLSDMTYILTEDETPQYVDETYVKTEPILPPAQEIMIDNKPTRIVYIQPSQSSVSFPKPTTTQSYITKLSDGSYVQLKPGSYFPQVLTSSNVSSVTKPIMPKVAFAKTDTRPLLQHAGVKRSHTGKPKQMIAKLIITGNQQTGQQTQPILLNASSNTFSDEETRSAVRFITSHTNLDSFVSSGQNLSIPLSSFQTTTGGSILGNVATKTLLPVTHAQQVALNNIVSSPVKNIAPLLVTASPSKITHSNITMTGGDAMKLGFTKVATPTVLAGTSGQQTVLVKRTTGPPGTGGKVMPQLIRLATAPHMQQIQGKQFQYIRFVTTNTPTSGVTTSSFTTVKQPLTTVAGAQQPRVVFTTAGQQQALKMEQLPPGIRATLIAKPGTSGKVTGGPQHIILPSTMASAIGQLRNTSGDSVLSTNQQGKVIVLPSNYLQQLCVPSSDQMKNTTSKKVTTIPCATSNLQMQSTSLNIKGSLPSILPVTTVDNKTIVEPIIMKKPCNCTKSQCLKLYCDCFANGEFCNSCNCTNCSNNIDHEDERQRAIKSCLERNPQAFRPKIVKGHGAEFERKHHKGCHCKRSGCLKNYCECYEAKIPCSDMCKCRDCKNLEEPSDEMTLKDLADAAEVRAKELKVAKSKMSTYIQDVPVFKPPFPFPEKQVYSFITSEVIEATCTCLLAKAEESESKGFTPGEVEKNIIEEFGKCLLEIVACTNKSNV